MESVWDYPRPPRLEPCAARARVYAGGQLVADSARALRVLETSHPPGIYLPPEDVDDELVVPVAGSSFCEWKGVARYFDVAGVARAAWAYPAPVAAYAALRDHVSFYPGRVDRCLLDDVEVQPQEGDFYGGWISPDVTGPFKGPPGTRGW